MANTIAEDLNQDIIREVGNIISNHGATAFAKMIRDSININTQIEFISIADFQMEVVLTEDFSSVFKSIADEVVEGFFLKTSKGADGMSVILFNQDHADKIVKSIAGESENVEYRKEVLKEFSSIVINAYISALGNLIGNQIEATMPIPAKDILGCLYDFKEKLTSRNEKEALLMKTNILAEETRIKGKLIILLEPESLNKIIDVLRKQSGA